MHTSIALILDGTFGNRIFELAQEMPVWVVSSSINDHAVHLARMVTGTFPITTISIRQKESPADLLARALYAIDEHHGEVSLMVSYNTIWVYGTSEKVSETLVSDLGFKSIVYNAAGFKVEK